MNSYLKKNCKYLHSFKILRPFCRKLEPGTESSEKNLKKYLQNLEKKTDIYL